jgi:signal transduction histidine kinase
VTHAWQATRWWDVYVAVVTVAVAALVLVSENARPLGLKVPSALAILAFAAWYAALGRRLLARYDARLVWTFVAGTAVLYATATLFAPAATFLSFVLLPLVFNLVDFLPGTVAVAGLNLIPPAAHLVRTGDVAETLIVLVPIAVLITGFSAAFAYWVHQIARQSAERADLIEQLNASRAEVARLSREAGVTAERQRLSGEIHDTIAQGLSSVVMLVQAAEADLDRDTGGDTNRARHHLRMAGRSARESLAEARALVAGLLPARLRADALALPGQLGADALALPGQLGADALALPGQLGADALALPGQLPEASLAAVLARLAERFREETGIPVDVRTAARSDQLPMAAEVVLLRATQEGLANVRKHARATAVTLELAYPPGSAVLTVTDNGVGAETTDNGGFGLAGMRARAADIGGTLRVERAPGGGTKLTVMVPA